MTDIERFILLNQAMMMTALAQLMDRYSQKSMADSLDEAAIKTIKFIKLFDAPHNKEPSKEPSKNNLK